MKQLDRLLFLQGGRCFFCNEYIPEGQASVEHLVASANGGANDDGNCVVCCKSINLALGSLPIKSKIQAILSHRGTFRCPVRPSQQATAGSVNAETHLLLDRMNSVVADLVKRGSARPRRVATLKNTINALFQMGLTEVQIDELLTALQSRGYVAIDDTKVSYALPTGA